MQGTTRLDEFCKACKYRMDKSLFGIRITYTNATGLTVPFTRESIQDKRRATEKQELERRAGLVGITNNVALAFSGGTGDVGQPPEFVEENIRRPGDYEE